jgi:hypothetical protein
MHAKTVLSRAAIACITIASVVLSLATACVSQGAPESQPDAALSQALNKYPGLLPELGQLLDKLKHNVQIPAARQRSDLLPLLPASTSYYAAFPNYGEAAHQALAIFREELKESAALRALRTQGDMAKTGPQLEDFVQKLYLLSQFVGSEIVVSGELGESNRSFLIVAEVRKPGLKDFLRTMLKGLGDNSKPGVQILDTQELAKTRGRGKAGEPIVLVRRDYVIVAPDLNAARWFNNLLNQKREEFASTPFGQKVAKAYAGGIATLVAADLHKILSQFPLQAPASRMMLDRSGFKDVDYLIWNHKNVASQSVSEMELSFMGPRHGAASWLAEPARLGTLDFVSPNAAIAIALRLKDMGEIFDDVKELSAISNPKAFADFMQIEQLMGISLKDDLLSQLQGEITLELSDVDTPQPKMAAILRVENPDRLQSTLEKILSQTPVHDVPFEPLWMDT